MKNIRLNLSCKTKIRIFFRASFVIICFILFTGIDVASGATFFAKWIINFEDATWNTTVTLDNTQVRWNYAELKNGFNPAHEWYGTSEGSMSTSTEASKLNDPNDKHSYRFTAVATKGVKTIGLLPYYPKNAPNYTVSIQADDGTGHPDGNKLAEGTIIGADTSSDVWYFINLTNIVNLTKKSVYHIVIEYKDGTIGSDNYWNANSMRPQVNWTVGNYGGWDGNVDTPDPMIMALHFSHTDLQWHTGNASPIFVLVFTDGTYFGQPYKHRYLNYIGNYRARQYFKVTRQNKTVTKLYIPAWVKGEDILPNDIIHYWIKDEKENTLRNGGLAEPSIQKEFTWYNDTFAPLELKRGKTYIIEIYSNPTNGNHLTIEASDVYPYESYEFQNATWNGADGFVKRSNNNGSTWGLRDEARDIPFKLKLVDVFEGNITSIEKDAESIGSKGDVWKQIKFEGSIPSGTSVSIYVNSPNCGGFVKIKDNAVSGIIYDLPYYAQERYASWRLILHTNNSSITPEIYSVTFIGSKSIVTGTIPEKELVYPNPYIKGKSLNERINFSNLPKETTINIYTVSGELVKIIRHKNISSGGNAHWDISAIASGIYIYYLESPEEKKRGKVSIIK